MKNLLLLCALFVHQILCAQENATGIILVEGDNSPLVGVTVDDSFSLSIPVSSRSLFFSYTGYQTKKIPIAECQNVAIYLSVATTLLNEVVMTGYDTQIRSELADNITTIKKEDIEGTPVNSNKSMLHGRVTGVFVNNESDKLGYNIDVRNRGTATLNASLQPISVVDGVIINTDFFFGAIIG